MCLAGVWEGWREHEMLKRPGERLPLHLRIIFDALSQPSHLRRYQHHRALPGPGVACCFHPHLDRRRGLHCLLS
jgi:hypothetical protein